MWKVAGQALTMTEEDYGVSLVVQISGVTLSSQDTIRVVIKDRVNGETKVSKDYTTFEDNTFDLVITNEESSLLPVGNYVYALDWYQSGNFMCNLIERGIFRVVEKA